MNITFTPEELKAIAHDDYSVFDHELSAYELKAAMRQVVAELSSSEPIRKLQAEIEVLKGSLDNEKARCEMAIRLCDSRGEAIDKLQERIKLLDTTLEELDENYKKSVKHFNEQRFKNRELADALGRMTGERDQYKEKYESVMDAPLTTDNTEKAS